jgi:hypothetical protein
VSYYIIFYEEIVRYIRKLSKGWEEEERGPIRDINALEVSNAYRLWIKMHSRQL